MKNRNLFESINKGTYPAEIINLSSAKYPASGVLFQTGGCLCQDKHNIKQVIPFLRKTNYCKPLIRNTSGLCWARAPTKSQSRQEMLLSMKNTPESCPAIHNVPTITASSSLTPVLPGNLERSVFPSL